MQKGIDADKIAALTPLEKLFYAASMKLALEEETEKYSVLMRGDR